jgi:hypothetical protein
MVLSTDVILEADFLIVLRIIAGILFGVWLVLVVMGKGGFVHILLLNAIGVEMVEIMTVVRTRMTV